MRSKKGRNHSIRFQIPSNCRLLFEWILSFNSHCIIRKAMSYVEHHHTKRDVFVVYSSSRDCLDSKEFEFGYWAWKIRHHKNVEMHEIYYYYGSINIHTDMEQIKMWNNIFPLHPSHMKIISGTTFFSHADTNSSSHFSFSMENLFFPSIYIWKRIKTKLFHATSVSARVNIFFPFPFFRHRVVESAFAWK